MARRGAKGPERVGQVLGGVLQKSGLVDQLARVEVLEEWAGRVGEAVARVTRPREVSGGTLVVEVRSSPWLMELNMMKGEFLRRINEGRQTRIERLVFVLGEDQIGAR